MMNNTDKTLPRSDSADIHAARRTYTPPRMWCLGDVRDLTMGGSPGMGDSGTSLVEEPGGGKGPHLLCYGPDGNLQDPSLPCYGPDGNLQDLP